MAIHPKRTAGIIFVKIDGDQMPAKGSFEYKLSGLHSEAIDNADGSMALGGKYEHGYIKGTISNYNEIDHAVLKNAEGVTVTLELGNGKVIVAKDAAQTDEAIGAVEGGEFPVQFDSESVEEVR